MSAHGLRRILVAAVCLAVVAFVGRNFLKVRMKPKAPEWRLNLAAIRTAELQHFAEHGEYVAAPPVPRDVPVGEPSEWPLDPDAPHGFNTLRFAPWDLSRCSYAVATGEASFTAVAVCDPMDRGEPIAWAYVAAPPDATRGVPGPFGRCPAEGVWSPRGTPALNRIGPCDEASARKVPF